MTGVARILDANANRAREALRVMEDYARFILDDPDLSGRAKSIRHDLRAAVSMLPDGWIELNRDTPDDVGTKITTEAERLRQSTTDVVIAAGKRLSEAFRCLEEYGKTCCDEFASSIEALRYRGYELERQLQSRLGWSLDRDGVPQWRMCVLLTEAFCKRPWLEVLDAAIENGADCIQLREKNLDDGKLLGRANVVARRCREANIASVINDRPDIAAMIGATGVHVGQTDLPVGHIRRMLGRTIIIGQSTTNLVQAEGAIRSGADYLGLGPMFRTTTKHKPDLAGPEYVKAYQEKFDHPYLAIGGIDETNIDELVRIGVRGVAICGAICGAEDPGALTKRLVEAVSDATAAPDR